MNVVHYDTEMFERRIVVLVGFHSRSIIVRLHDPFEIQHGRQ